MTYTRIQMARFSEHLARALQAPHQTEAAQMLIASAGEILPFQAAMCVVNRRHAAPIYICDTYPDPVAKQAVQRYVGGTYLLNPEGFRHAPFSREGCVIFVKLRQYAGVREHFCLHIDALAWEPGPEPGVEVKDLYSHPDFPDSTRLERWVPGTAPGVRTHPSGAEIFVLEGSFEDERDRYPQYSWLRLPAGEAHEPRSEQGCIFYIKTGALASLRSV